VNKLLAALVGPVMMAVLFATAHPALAWSVSGCQEIPLPSWATTPSGIAWCKAHVPTPPTPAPLPSAPGSNNSNKNYSNNSNSNSNNNTSASNASSNQSQQQVQHQSSRNTNTNAATGGSVGKVTSTSAGGSANAALNARVNNDIAPTQNVIVAAPTNYGGGGSAIGNSCRWGSVGIYGERDNYGFGQSNTTVGGHLDVALGNSGYACKNSEANNENITTPVTVTVPAPQPAAPVVVQAVQPVAPAHHETSCRPDDNEYLDLKQITGLSRRHETQKDVNALARLLAACTSEAALHAREVDP
jgi:hypothetical protein